jgi:glutamine synthetase
MTELGNSVAAAGKYGVVQRALLAQVGELLASAQKKADVLESEAAKAKSIAEVPKQAAAFRDKVFPALQKLRADVDELEGIVPRDLWPVPVYSDMLFKL